MVPTFVDIAGILCARVRRKRAWETQIPRRHPECDPSARCAGVPRRRRQSTSRGRWTPTVTSPTINTELILADLQSFRRQPLAEARKVGEAPAGARPVVKASTRARAVLTKGAHLVGRRPQRDRPDAPRRVAAADSPSLHLTCSTFDEGSLDDAELATSLVAVVGSPPCCCASASSSPRSQPLDPALTAESCSPATEEFGPRPVGPRRVRDPRLQTSSRRTEEARAGPSTARHGTRGGGRHPHGPSSGASSRRRS